MQARLDHLVDLGINAIYFNPIFQSAANHRYHTHDYYRVDPVLGDNEAFRKFLDAAHDRGIRVMLDARELAVGLIRGRLRRQYPDLSPRALNLKVLEEVARVGRTPPGP